LRTVGIGSWPYTYGDAPLDSCVWLLCVNSASGSHYYAKGETFFPLWTQYLSSGSAIPLTREAFFLRSVERNWRYQRRRCGLPPTSRRCRYAHNIESHQLRRPVLTCCLVFSDAVSGHRRESPILGERKKRFSRVVRVGFHCPLRAFTGKLPIFARCDHRRCRSAEISPTRKS
jgi:hypothetical protein